MQIAPPLGVAWFYPLRNGEFGLNQGTQREREIQRDAQRVEGAHVKHDLFGAKARVMGRTSVGRTLPIF